MNLNDIIQTILVYALPVLFAITLHEAAHAYAARYFGDNTAYMMGRMSLNPVKHIDPFGTLVLPIALYILTAGSFLIGYAKPVPVNFGHLKKPKRDMAWVALAGPAANLLMALLWMIFGLLLQDTGVNEEFFLLMARAGVLTNLFIFAFNLFPLPPLDGGRIVVSLLPHHLAYKYAQLERYGFFIVLGLVMLGGMSLWMKPVVQTAFEFLVLLTSPLR